MVVKIAIFFRKPRNHLDISIECLIFVTLKEIEFKMNTKSKAIYEAPQTGRPELLLERAILNSSWLETPVDAGTNEGITWGTDSYVE